ncbi:MAG TPA: altronate dehydratase family protein [Verrucomicrobiae bacterium]|jgi:altronate hydrolase|nr:altronate dehydratase family protein [Verrucomicrobiae bacterium]
MNDRRNQPPVLLLNPTDPLVVATRDLAVGEAVGLGDITPSEPIGRGHKLAIKPIESGAPVRKLGQVIGIATKEIAPGQHIHVHNVEFRPSTADHAIGAHRSNMTVLPEDQAATFQGIVRPDGSVATRNYIGVLTTVNCSATAARMISDHFRNSKDLEAFPNVDGVVALTHKSGCAGGVETEGNHLLRRTVAGYARHPNFAGVLIIGLGCESNQLSALVVAEELEVGSRIQTLVIQETGGTRKTVEAGIAKIKEMLPAANAVKRQKVPARHLILGLQCGGSDGFSAITANPALGVAADLLVRNGGTSILSETPEIYGAEHMLLGRAVSDEVGHKLLDLLRWWEDYAAKDGETLDNNPSPGNKAGGLTTILEKSLGAAAKGGNSNLVEVYRYAEPVTKSGFVFMDTPGYDPVSVTGQVAGGANMICFTTGRGSCFGCKPAPSLKLATNTPMYNRMAEDMDINCGEVLDGAASVEEMGERIFKLILETASGQRSKSELLGYGEDEFAPWHLGATL